MSQLIEIKSIPMSIEMKIKNATFELASGNAAVEVSKDSGGLKLKVQPTRISIDSFEAKNSTPPLRMVTNKAYEQNGIKSSYDATANYAREGNMLLNIQLKDNVLAELAARKFNALAGDSNTGVEPNLVGGDFDPQEISIRYDMDKLNFDWRMNMPEMVFTPGDIEIIIKEYARVEVEYIGSPIYVPPSSDPNYEPVDELA